MVLFLNKRDLFQVRRRAVPMIITDTLSGEDLQGQPPQTDVPGVSRRKLLQQR